MALPKNLDRESTNEDSRSRLSPQSNESNSSQNHIARSASAQSSPDFSKFSKERTSNASEKSSASSGEDSLNLPNLLENFELPLFDESVVSQTNQTSNERVARSRSSRAAVPAVSSDRENSNTQTNITDDSVRETVSSDELDGMESIGSTNAPAANSISDVETQSNIKNARSATKIEVITPDDLDEDELDKLLGLDLDDDEDDDSSETELEEISKIKEPSLNFKAVKKAPAALKEETSPVKEVIAKEVAKTPVKIAKARPVKPKVEKPIVASSVASEELPAPIIENPLLSEDEFDDGFEDIFASLNDYSDEEALPMAFSDSNDTATSSSSAYDEEPLADIEEDEDPVDFEMLLALSEGIKTSESSSENTEDDEDEDDFDSIMAMLSNANEASVKKVKEIKSTTSDNSDDEDEDFDSIMQKIGIDDDGTSETAKIQDLYEEEDDYDDDSDFNIDSLLGDSTALEDSTPVDTDLQNSRIEESASLPDADSFSGYDDDEDDDWESLLESASEGSVKPDSESSVTFSSLEYEDDDDDEDEYLEDQDDAELLDIINGTNDSSNVLPQKLPALEYDDYLEEDDEEDFELPSLEDFEPPANAWGIPEDNKTKTSSEELPDNLDEEQLPDEFNEEDFSTLMAAPLKKKRRGNTEESESALPENDTEDSDEESTKKPSALSGIKDKIAGAISIDALKNRVSDYFATIKAELHGEDTPKPGAAAERKKAKKKEEDSEFDELEKLLAEDDDAEESDEDNDDSDEDKPKKKSKSRGKKRGKGLLSIFGFLSPIKKLYLFVVNFIFGIITAILGILSSLPLIGFIFKPILGATKILRGIATYLPLVVVIGGMVLTSYLSVPRESEILLPDSGGAIAQKFSFDAEKKIASTEITNTGEVIANIDVNFTAYTLQPKLMNPVSWIIPKEVAKCKTTSASVDIDAKKTVTTKCSGEITGFFPRASGVLSE